MIVIRNNAEDREVVTLVLQINPGNKSSTIRRPDPNNLNVNRSNMVINQFNIDFNHSPQVDVNHVNVYLNCVKIDEEDIQEEIDY